MQGDKKAIAYLNKILFNELIAINQYFLHSRMLKDWGFSKLAHQEYKESIEEMEHADKLIERILFLQGIPNLQDLGKLRIGENIEEILKSDLALEHDAIPDLKEGIAYCESIKDFISRDLMQHILDNEEEHIDWLETQLGLIAKVGIENYGQSQMHVDD